ncbi:MAG: acyl-CoA dehydrogenase family protein [Actinomycetota bacterium]
MAIVSPESTTTTDDLIAELRAWLEDNWDPDLTVGDWWERLGLASWSAPSLPENAYGRGLARGDAARIAQEIGRFGALGAPGGLGLLLAAPTIATHGTQEQIDLYVRDIVTGRQAWCQLFSEPGAGSDLAGLSTKAVEQDGDWIINGQKVWTSGGQNADLGMLLARTDPSVPKHQGISYFALDMNQPGVDVRPLREMTGHAMFSEVFFSDARATSDTIIGGQNDGWAVANTTLAFERAGLGAGGGGAFGSMASPGTKAGQLERRAGDFVVKPGERGPSRRRSGAANAGRVGGATLLVGLAKGNGTFDDPVIRQGLARLHILSEIGRLNTERMKATRVAGGDIPGMANISKLLMSEMVRLSRDLGLQIVGAQGMLHATKPEDQKVLDEATGNPFLGGITMQALYAQGPSIYGGTDQIQLNVIGERALGLPKEPRDDHLKPFSEIPKNG